VHHISISVKALTEPMSTSSLNNNKTCDFDYAHSLMSMQ